MHTTNVRPHNRFYTFLIVCEAAILAAVCYMIFGDWTSAILAAAVSFCLLGWGLRLFFQRYYRRGIRQMYNKQYADAAKSFQESSAYFAAHPWIDKYCFLTMFSDTAVPYEQMALNNLGLCYLHLGRDTKALNVFKKIRDINPDFPHIDRSINEIEYHLENSKKK